MAYSQDTAWSTLQTSSNRKNCVAWANINGKLFNVIFSADFAQTSPWEAFKSIMGLFAQEQKKAR